MMTQSEFEKRLASELASRLRVIYECEQTFRRLLLLATKIHVTAPNGSELEADASALQSFIGAHRIVLEMERSQMAAVNDALKKSTAPATALH